MPAAEAERPRDREIAFVPNLLYGPAGLALVVFGVLAIGSWGKTQGRNLVESHPRGRWIIAHMVGARRRQALSLRKGWRPSVSTTVPR